MIMKILRGTVFGGIAYFLMGWLVWGTLLMDFYTANFNQCSNRPEMEMIWWAMIVSNLTMALLLTLFLKWSGAKGIVDSLKTGALFGFLYSISLDWGFYSMTTMYNNFTALIVDVVVNTLVMAVLGLVIVLLWGKEKTA
jgi:hypothetical protein